jgi:transcription antitermination protein NusB
MKSRHRAREIALQILYRYDVALQSTGLQPPQGSGLADDLRKHFDHFQVPDPVREFAALLVAGTLQNLPTLDQLLEKHAANWKITRMGFIDRNLLRMATFELTQVADTPHTVTIDEAVELAKQFGTAETSAFVNGILDAIRLEAAASGAPTPPSD